MCYRWTFLVLCILCAGTSCAGVWLTCRLRPLYVGERGTAIDYDAFIAAYGSNPLIPWLNRNLRPRCCCRFGRELVSFDDEEDDMPATPPINSVEIAQKHGNFLLLESGGAINN
jgi:hypothetical protein